jgi:hypothetical protein
MSKLQVFASAPLKVSGRRVDVRFAEVGGRLVCIGLELGPKVVDDPKEGPVFIAVEPDDLRELTASEMRFPLRRVIDAALQAALMVRAGTGDFEADARAFRRDMNTLEAERAEPRKRPGRPPSYGSDHFEAVAQIYSKHLRDGGRAPTKAVADHFKVQKSTAAKWVARARHDFQLIEANDG